MVAKSFGCSQSATVDRCNWRDVLPAAQIPHAAPSPSRPARVLRGYRVTSSALAPSVGARSQDRQPTPASDHNRSLQAQPESAIAKFVAWQKLICTRMRRKWELQARLREVVELCRAPATSTLRAGSSTAVKSSTRASFIGAVNDQVPVWGIVDFGAAMRLCRNIPLLLTVIAYRYHSSSGPF